MPPNFFRDAPLVFGGLFGGLYCFFLVCTQWNFLEALVFFVCTIFHLAALLLALTFVLFLKEGKHTKQEYSGFGLALLALLVFTGLSYWVDTVPYRDVEGVIIHIFRSH